MPISSQKLTKGLLTLGSVGTEKEWAGQVRAVSLAAEYDAEDDIPVLSGEKLAGDETKTETLTGTVLDDYKFTTSLFVWCKENEGEELPFTFEPNNVDGDLRISGTVKVRQIAIGGDVDSRTENDFEFRIVGETTAAAIPVGP